MVFKVVALQKRSVFLNCIVLKTMFIKSNNGTVFLVVFERVIYLQMFRRSARLVPVFWKNGRAEARSKKHFLWTLYDLHRFNNQEACIGIQYIYPIAPYIFVFFFNASIFTACKADCWRRLSKLIFVRKTWKEATDYSFREEYFRNIYDLLYICRNMQQTVFAFWTTRNRFFNTFSKML